MKVELDCGCTIMRDDGAVWDYGWWACPAGHGPQKLWRIIEPEPPVLVGRHLEHRAEFIRRYGKREIAD